MMDNSLSRNFPLGIQMMTLVFIFFLSNLIGSSFVLLVESQVGFNIREVSEGLLVEQRGLLRLMLFFSNAFMFFFPGIIFSIFLYRKEWLKSVRADKMPSSISIILSLVIILSSAAMVAYSFQMNNWVPLPEWMKAAEEQNQHLITAALTMDNWGELFVNLFIVALIPAIGEEWIFRGVLQDRLLKLLKNKHLAVWLMAILFSAVHMQFHAFVPRMLLGAILGYMFLWSGSLWLPIIAHFFNNAYQVVDYFIRQMYGDGTDLDINKAIDIPEWQALLSTIAVIGLMLVLRFISNKSKVQT